jgi:chitin synthase
MQFREHSKTMEFTHPSKQVNFPIPRSITYQFTSPFPFEQTLESNHSDAECVSEDSENSLEYSAITLENPLTFQSQMLPPILRYYNDSFRCKVIICITIYNEEASELEFTLKCVQKNVVNLVNMSNIDPNQIVVFLIQDGLEKLSESLVSFGKNMNIYDTSRIIQTENQHTLHLFSTFSNQLWPDLGDIQPIRIITGLKERNRGKLNSHLWFFHLICMHLNPDYCVLIDCGTEPKPVSIVYLVEEMDKDPDIGGVCGEIRVHRTRRCNFIEIAQDLEYRLSHVMDKATESIFGFVTVLPGAFSAYRWKCIDGLPLTEHYFYSLKPNAENTCFKANMYLAEDRVLSIALVLDPQNKIRLKYVDKSVALVDVPRNFVNIIQQRRRWINGSWFALMHAFRFFGNMKDTQHSFFRKLGLVLLIMFHAFSALVSYLSPSIFFMYLHFILNKAFTDELDCIGPLLKGLYGAIILILFVTSLGNRPSSTPRIYRFCGIMMGIITIVAVVLSVMLMLKENVTLWIVLYVLGIMICLLVCSAIHGHLLPVLCGIVPYIFMLPCYINIFLIFAFCNVHDVTWGLRNDKEGKRYIAHGAGVVDKTEEFRVFRTGFLAAWILANFVFIYVFAM